VTTLNGIEDGSLEARPQPAEGVSYAPKITVDDAHVDWDEPAVGVDRRIRACTPAPGAWTTYAGARVKLGPVTHSDERLDPGRLRVAKAEVLVGTATTAVRLGDVKAFGARQMPAADWARGLRLPATARFGSAEPVDGVE
jgi:methionyl-tRNA formyltransferase